MEINLANVRQGWEFVNLFYDKRAAIYYCRIRKEEWEKNQNDWREVTGQGETAAVALEDADLLAAL